MFIFLHIILMTGNRRYAASAADIAIQAQIISAVSFFIAFRSVSCYIFLMARLTEEEAYALDDFVTNNEITLGPNGTDWLTQREMRLWGMSNMTVNYLMTKAAADHKTPAQIIDEMVQERVAAAV